MEEMLLDACRYIGRMIHVKIYLGDGSLEGIAEASGFLIKNITLTGKWWQNDHGPMLGRLQTTGQAVALLPSPRHGYIMVRGSQRIPVSSSISLSPEAVTFYPILPVRKLGLQEVVRFGWHIVATDLLAAIIVTVCLLGMVLCLIFSAAIFNEFRLMGDDAQGAVGIQILVISVAKILLWITRQTALRRIQTRLQTIQQIALYERALRVPVSTFQMPNAPIEFAEATAGIISRIGMSELQILLDAFFIGGLMLALILVNPLWGISIFVVLIILFVLTGILGIVLYKYQHHYLQHSKEEFKLVSQAIRGILKIRLLKLESNLIRDWLPIHDHVRKRWKSLQKVVGISRLLDSVILLTIFVVVFLSFPRVGLPTFVGVIVIYELVRTSTDASKRILELSTLLPTYERHLMPILEAVPGGFDLDEHHSEDNPVRSLKGAMRVRALSFRYSAESHLVLDNVSLHVAVGERVAIIGPSGSGKSTLLKLLIGLEQAQTGEIYYDDQRLTDWHNQTLRRQIGVALQTSRIQVGDIWRNITGFRQLPSEEIWEALRLAEMDTFVASLPMKLHTLLDEGGTVLSKGQRQRLLLARALVNRPRLLLLDNITSGIDEETEAKIFANLKPYTCLMIAQRLSTVRAADRIYILDKGQIIQQGKYAELLNASGYFAEWARRQML